MLSQRPLVKRHIHQNRSQYATKKANPIKANQDKIACQFSHKKALVLDLDETLIYCCKFPPHGNIDFIRFDDNGETYYIFKRPGLDDFLKKMNNLFEIYIFTYSEKSYAEPIIEKICPFIDKDHRLYRESCKIVFGLIHKNLKFFHRPIEEVLLIDDNPDNLKFYPDNTILIEKWFGAQHDNELIETIPNILNECLFTDDVQSVTKNYTKKRKHCFSVPSGFYSTFNSL